MKLNKTEVVKIMQRISKEKGFDLTQGDIKEIIDIIDETIVKVGEQLEVGESSNVGCVVVSKAFVKGRTGKSALPGRDEEWTSKDKEVLKLKLKESVKKDTTVEK